MSDPTETLNSSAPPPAEALVSSAAAAVEVLHAWLRLLEAEWALAGQALYWLVVGAIAVPVIALGAWLGLAVALLAALHAGTGSWLAASLLVAGAQLLLLGFVLGRLRRRARELTLPHSRAAWVRVTGRAS